MKRLNQRGIAFQLIVFVIQWVLMIIGFGILALLVGPFHILVGTSLGRYFDAGIKAVIALVLSISWLFIWDRQVRLYFYGKREGTVEPV